MIEDRKLALLSVDGIERYSWTGVMEILRLIRRTGQSQVRERKNGGGASAKQERQRNDFQNEEARKKIP